MHIPSVRQESRAQYLDEELAPAHDKPPDRSAVERLDKRPHNESEFLNSLAQEAAKNQLTYKNDHEVFRDFTAKMTGLDDERRRAKEERDGGDGGGGGKEEKKGKKGKKGKK